MRYCVFGAGSSTGRDITLIVEAESASAAEAVARAHGVFAAETRPDTGQSLLRNHHDLEFSVGEWRLIQSICYALIFAIAGTSVTLRWDSLKPLWGYPANTVAGIILAGRIALSTLVVYFVAVWITATLHEMKLWVRWLAPAFTRPRVYMSMLLLVLALGFMVILIYNPVVFAAYLMSFFVLHYWSQWICNDYFKRAMARTTTDARSLRALRVLQHYWLVLPQTGRIMMMMFFASIAFSIALAGAVGLPARREVLEAISIWLIAADLLVGEAIIAWWRYKRDVQLERIQDDPEQQKQTTSLTVP